MTVIEEHAENLGYHHCLIGYSISANPYPHTDHGLSDALTAAYRRGYARAEVDQADGAHFKEAKA